VTAMRTVWHEAADLLWAAKAAVATKGNIHLAVREMPGEGIEAACGAISKELPLDHSFTSDPGEVTHGACLTPRHVWDNAVSYRGAQ
jgi:hypothetical protein